MAAVSSALRPAGFSIHRWRPERATASPISRCTKLGPQTLTTSTSSRSSSSLQSGHGVGEAVGVDRVLTAAVVGVGHGHEPGPERRVRIVLGQARPRACVHLAHPAEPHDRDTDLAVCGHGRVLSGAASSGSVCSVSATSDSMVLETSESGI